MGFYYTIQLKLEFIDNLSSVEEEMLRFVLGISSEVPGKFPGHSYFDNRKGAVHVLPGGYSCFNEGEYVCCHWGVADAAKNGERGVNLYLPGLKDDYVWEIVELLSWVATLSSSHGFVGFKVSEYVDWGVTLFYVKEKKLFIADAKPCELAAFDTGEKVKIDDF